MPPAAVKANSSKFTANYLCCFKPPDLRRGQKTLTGDASAAAVG
jgi:hypothetical protein